MSVNGTGILAEGTKGKVTIEQGASILTNANNGSINYAIAANGGTVNIHYDTLYGTANSGVSNIYGNIGLLDNGGTIKLAVTGKGSTLDGVAVHTGGSGTLELTLSDGAVWTNEAYGAMDTAFNGSVIDTFNGGSSEGAAGFIVQKDTHSLTILYMQDAAISIFCLVSNN